MSMRDDHSYKCMAAGWDAAIEVIDELNRGIGLKGGALGAMRGVMKGSLDVTARKLREHKDEALRRLWIRSQRCSGFVQTKGITIGPAEVVGREE